MQEPQAGRSKRARGAYSRLICLGCRERRIRCELPDTADIPAPGELLAVKTPCYRCRRLGLQCIVRQTILGRPRNDDTSPTDAPHPSPAVTTNVVSRVFIELPSRPGTIIHRSGKDDEDHASRTIMGPLSSYRVSHSPRFLEHVLVQPRSRTLLVHKPQSTETVVIIRAIDTLHREKVDREWFRHLPSHFGHTPALDLSIKALVAACAYARRVPKLTAGDCYQALSIAIKSVQTTIALSKGDLDDNMLASTALLAHFEGALRKHGIPSRLHVDGLAAILTARSATFPVTQLAREILDYHASDSATKACIKSLPSPFENVARRYYAIDGTSSGENGVARLKALGIELLIRFPRLLGLVRSLRTQALPWYQLIWDAKTLTELLLGIQDSQAESWFLQTVKISPALELDASIDHSFHFAFIDDFEALIYYWQSRLALLRLDRQIEGLATSCNSQDTAIDELVHPPDANERQNEMFRVVINILMCADYVAALPLRKHDRLFAHAMVAVWGVTKNMSMELGYTEDQELMGLSHEWLLRIVNRTLAEKPDLTAEDMDIAAEIFVGGKPHGRYAELYGS